MAMFAPRGPGYAPSLRLRRRVVALRGGDDAIVLGFAWVGTAVRIRVLAAGEPSSDDVEAAIDAGRRITAVDDDPTPFLKMVSEHPLLGPISRRHDARIEMTPTVFETFAIAVIEQLVTGIEARASIRRLWRTAGEAVPGTNLVAAPTAAAVKRVPMWRLREIGIGARRAVTLHNGAGRGAAIERLRGVAPSIALEKIQSLPGVGPWTANAVAKKGFGWADAVPVGDFHAPFTITEALGGPSLRREQAAEADAHMLSLLDPFRPYRARVALLLELMQNRTYRLPKIDPHRREPWKY
jgi:3-methyladenine DNA glycosylase/8-oxoguanine DNA glycosylase